MAKPCVEDFASELPNHMRRLEAPKIDVIAGRHMLL